jgi:tetratricopeptide (TPR) repeat protein
MMKPAIVLSFVFLALAACAPAVKDKAGASAAEAETDRIIAEAEGLFKQGAYVPLKEACRLYGELYARPALRKRIALPYFEAAFLLALREREVGIAALDRLDLCKKIIAENPNLSGFGAWVDLAATIYPRIKGTIRDYVSGLTGAVQGAGLKAGLEELRKRAPLDVLAAYLYLAVSCPNKSAYGSREDVEAILSAHPASALLAYRAAFCPDLRVEALEAVLAANPEFYEIRGFLGEAALGRGNLVSAERDLLAAYEKIPDSPYYPILLAGIYFLTEEFERSIEFCDQAIALAPEYRDAYLTKAIDLSYLQKYREAIEVLNTIVALQYYLLGESHYWLAWNSHALKDNEAAQVHIEESKGRLPTNSEVFGLAGTIALEKNELDRAVREFGEALKHNASNTEALFGLGAIADLRNRWVDGAGHYERAAAVLVENETALNEKIAQIKAAEIAAERKARMLAKKESQLRIVLATRATAHYNAAVDWANAGRKDKALGEAEKAAAHPQFRDRAADLILRLKK